MRPAFITGSFALIFVILIPLLSFSQEIHEPDHDTIVSPARAEEHSLSQRIDQVFTPFVKVLGEILFWDPFSAIGIYDSSVYDKQGKPAIDNLF